MEFGLSDDQRMLQESITRFCRERITLDSVRAQCGSGSCRDPALWQELVELGIAGILVPEDAGGAGLTLFDAILVCEALAYTAAPVPYLGSAVLAPLALTRSSGDWQDQLRQIASGKLQVGFGLTEAVSRREDAGVRPQGGKALFVMDAAQADALLLGTIDNQLIWVDASAADVQPLATIDQTRDCSLVTLHGQPGTVLANGDRGAALIRKLIGVARVALAADMLGSAQAMLDKAVAYSLERKQFDRPIGSFQAVKHLCADMAAHLEPCRALTWYAAHSHSAMPDEFALMSCHAKAHLAEVGSFVAKTATEVHGGMGFTDLLGLHYWFKRIGFDRQFLGGPELVRAEAAQLQGYC